MRIDDIECFRVLAETLNYTNAANRLYLTQSSLTRTIQQMEDELGFQLFDRTRRSVSLTAAGQCFYQNCETVIDSYNSAVEKARHACEGKVGNIRFATHVYSSNGVVYDILGGFQQEYPEILVKVCSSDTEDMIHDLNEGLIDCAICTGKPASMNIERIVLRKYRDCIVVSPGHRLSEREEVDFRELRDERFATISHSSAGRGYEEIRTHARAAGFDPHIEENANSVAHLLAIVSTGRYVTMLSDNYKHLASGKLIFVPLSDEGTVELSFIWNRNTVNPSVRILADYIRQNFKRKTWDED